jgi:hypothetical protein
MSDNSFTMIEDTRTDENTGFCEIDRNLVQNLVQNQSPTPSEHKTGRWFRTRFRTKLKFAHFAIL